MTSAQSPATVSALLAARASQAPQREPGGGEAPPRVTRRARLLARTANSLTPPARSPRRLLSSSEYISGDEEQGRKGGEQEPADHGAPERSVLLAALAQTERHGQHADDHGEARSSARVEAASCLPLRARPERRS